MGRDCRCECCVRANREPTEPNLDCFVGASDDGMIDYNRIDVRREARVTCKPLPLTDIQRHAFPATVWVNEIETITRPTEWI
jgi:hypothetical protein